MQPPKKKKNSGNIRVMFVSVTIILMLALGGVFLVKLLMSDSEVQRKRRIQTVTLVTPPPPPKVKEIPPEPEIKQKEEFVEPENMEEPQEDVADQGDDDTPPIDDLLGIDADGSGGMDGFGLKAKKGGRALIGSDSGTQFKWYTVMFQKRINDYVQNRLDETGGIPEGTLKTYVRIKIDDEGRVVAYKILRSSGNTRMDQAVSDALSLADIGEMPPLEMPRVMKFRISSQGKDMAYSNKKAAHSS